MEKSMKYDLALKVVESESNEQTADRIVELYHIINYLERKIKKPSKSCDGCAFYNSNRNKHFANCQMCARFWNDEYIAKG